MESEGPYKISEFEFGWISHGPDGDLPFTDKDGADYDATRLNIAHAAGRKAERERNWKTVAKLCGVNPHTCRPCIEKVEEKFWCPICVCAGKIRGGQDGK